MVEVPAFQPDRVDVRLLDCVAVNVAVLLQLEGAPDLRTPFAFEWHFALDAATGMPALERSPLAARVLATTGFALEVRVAAADEVVDACAAIARGGGRALVLGDAVAMPWQPYFGRESMEHTFVVDRHDEANDRFHIVDAYANATEWGEAAPTQLELGRGELTAAIAALRSPAAGTWMTLERRPAPTGWDPLAAIRDNAAAMAGQAGEIGRFHAAALAGHRDGEAMKGFSLACWLVHRARALHALWLADVAAAHAWAAGGELAAAFEREVVGRWRRVNELAYLVYRRARLGKAPPMACFDALAEIEAVERRLALQLGERSPRPAGPG